LKSSDSSFVLFSQPTQTSCKCPNPLEAQHRKSYKTWSLAHAANKQEALDTDFVDVVFLGDSITEGWRGTSLGKSVEYKEPNVKVFNSLFHVDQGADFQGLPLGIAGDKVSDGFVGLLRGELDKNRHLINNNFIFFADISLVVENTKW
jgi:lysophospholipase L1-like esterase